MPHRRADNNNFANSLSSTNPPSGIFAWIVSKDAAYCDALATESFGFTVSEGQIGLPIKSFLDRIHPDDLAAVARAIHGAVVTGQPYQEEYRICRPDGSTVNVMALGTCFRDARGEPSHFAGMVVPVEAKSPPADLLITLCLQAHAVAAQSGRSNVADEILEILRKLDLETVDGAARRAA